VPVVAFHVFEHHHGACKHEKERNQIGAALAIAAIGLAIRQNWLAFAHRDVAFAHWVRASTNARLIW
jgi:hypothetical protein